MQYKAVHPNPPTTPILDTPAAHILFIPFFHCPLANQGYMGNVPQLSMVMIMMRGHNKIWEVPLPKLRPDWRRVGVHYHNLVQTAGVHRLYSFVQFGQNPCTQIVDNTEVKWREKTSPSLINLEKKHWRHIFATVIKSRKQTRSCQLTSK